MKFLLDMMMSPRLAPWLESLGHDVVHASAVGLAQAADTEILDYATGQGRAVVTADLDFPRLLAIHGSDAPAVILFRGGGLRVDEVKLRLGALLESVDESEISTSIIVVEPERIRRRGLPL